MISHKTDQIYHSIRNLRPFICHQAHQRFNRSPIIEISALFRWFNTLPVSRVGLHRSCTTVYFAKATTLEGFRAIFPLLNIRVRMILLDIHAKKVVQLFPSLKHISDRWLRKKVPYKPLNRSPRPHHQINV